MNVPDDIEARILDKAEYVEEAVHVLAEKQSLDKDTYREDREQRAIVEREFQTAIEACIDIAGLLLRPADEPMSETSAGRFESLEGLGVLSSKTSERMQNAAGFRNVLAHQYGAAIDDEVVYQHLQSELQVFVDFLRKIRAFLDLPDR